ncbi:MAG: 8-amino-7-oxononanoate synthase [Rhodocyclaceae bacterium]|nr:MAG: 8-amino-7-oxononanoate synthase [Rhodocyclaceae bacterium]
MILDPLRDELASLEAEGLKRRRRIIDSPCTPECVVDGKTVVAFCSNDYLGLANAPELIAAAREAAVHWGVGSGASHLVSGHLRPHETAEQALAAYVGFPAVLTFSTGYMANLAVTPALAGRGDAIFADKLNHASLIDAAQLSRAEHVRYPHNDVAALAALLEKSPAKQKLILTDAVFSMDGDLAPLPELVALAERHDAWLVVDDAHGFGVLGEHGRGTLAHFGIKASSRLVLMGTLGKAAGVAGAFVAADPVVIDWLVNKARSYIFTTAASPVIAATLAESVSLLVAGDARRTHLFQRIAQLRDGLAGTRWQLCDSPTAIQPIIVGDNHEALALAEALFERGLWVPAIRPPTVPKGTARLRVTLSAAHSEAQVAQLVDALKILQ